MTKRRIAIAVGAVGAIAVIGVWKLRGSADTPATGPQVTRSAPLPPNSAPPAPRGSNAADELVFVSDDDRAGMLRLEGQVLDERDHPAADAEVTINTNPSRTVRTEADGSFHVDELVGRAYTIVARGTAGFAGPVVARLTSTSEPVVLRLRPAASLEVRVTSRDERPIAGATVEARALSIVSGTTDRDGKVRLTGLGAGPYTLVASATGYAKAFQEVRIPNASENGILAARIQIRLQPGAAVAGRVLSPDGVAVAGARVRYSALASFAGHADPLRDAVTTDAQGRFRFDAIGTGTYRFLATHADHAPGTSPPFKLDGASARDDIEIRLQPAATLAGEVVSKAGDPIAFATVRITARAAGAAYEAPRQASTDERGHFEITGLPRREMQLVALHETASSAVLTVDLTNTPAKRDLVIKLDEDGVIGGVVVDDAGQPIANATVWANLKVGTGDKRFLNQLRGFSQEMSDGAGRFTIHGLSAGDYVAFASRGVGPRAGKMRSGPGTPAHVGDTNVKIVLPAEGGIQGVVAFADGTAPQLFTVNIGKATPVPFMTSDGHFLVTGLAAGTVAVRVEGPMFDPRGVDDVVIPPGKIADVGTIVVHKGRSISGRVLTGDGQPAPNATVYAGAHLFGDGQQAGPIDINLPNARGSTVVQATSSDDGSYVLHGIGVADLTIMADHDTLGRSQMQLVPGSTDSTTLDLVLMPFSAIEGTITQGGQPLGGIAVTATAQSAATSSFVVSSGPDGTFRFDRLAPDTYKVSAVVGRTPKLGLQYTGATVTAVGGQTATVHLVVDDGVTLLVNVSAGGARLDRAIVYVLAGSFTIPNAKVLAQTAGIAPGFTFTGAALSGAPATVQSVPVGHYTVCAVAMPNEVDGMAKAFAYIDREGEHLPAVCVPVDVAAAPPQQSTSIQVTVPTYVPAPNGSGDPGGSGSGNGSGSNGSGGSTGKGSSS